MFVDLLVYGYRNSHSQNDKYITPSFEFRTGNAENCHNGYI